VTTTKLKSFEWSRKKPKKLLRKQKKAKVLPFSESYQGATVMLYSAFLIFSVLGLIDTLPTPFYTLLPTF
jgi:hypothetical protein